MMSLSVATIRWQNRDKWLSKRLDSKLDGFRSVWFVRVHVKKNNSSKITRNTVTICVL